MIENNDTEDYLNQTNSKGMSALYHSMSCGNEAVVERLLSIKNININGKKGKYPFNAALAKKNDKLVSLLLAREDMTTYLLILATTKESTLIFCTKHGMERSVRALLDKRGVDANYRDGSGRQALDYALDGGHTQLVSVLMQHTRLHYSGTDGVTAYMEACRKSSRPHCHCGSEMTLYMGSKSLEWNCDARHEPAGCVCGSGWNRVVFNQKRYRCSMGCNFHYCEQCVLKKNFFPEESDAMRRAIIAQGNMFNLFCQVDCNGMTALMHAAAAGNLTVVDILLDRCTDRRLVAFGSYVGKSALSVALACGKLHIANKLVDFLSCDGDLIRSTEVDADPCPENLPASSTAIIIDEAIRNAASYFEQYLKVRSHARHLTISCCNLIWLPIVISG